MATHAPSLPARTRKSRVLQIWTPEDKAFWEREGKAIANLNLWISIPALFLDTCARASAARESRVEGGMPRQRGRYPP